MAPKTHIGILLIRPLADWESRRVEQQAGDFDDYISWFWF